LESSRGTREEVFRGVGKTTALNVVARDEKKVTRDRPGTKGTPRFKKKGHQSYRSQRKFRGNRHPKKGGGKTRGTEGHRRLVKTLPAQKDTNNLTNEDQRNTFTARNEAPGEPRLLIRNWEMGEGTVRAPGGSRR